MKRSKAFALIEMLISAIILCLLVYALTFSFKNVTSAEKQKDELTSSILAVKSKMEEMKNMSYQALPSYDNSTFDGGKGTVSVSPYGSDKMVIVVKDGAGQLMTIRSKYE
jgi:type II secretory pathway pseudopilin PulG